MCTLLLDLQPGDEVIMPSFAFVSTANACALRGGVPVFVDIRADTWNIDETLIEAAITPRTKAIMVVHYGGVACEMDTIMAIAAAHGLAVVEDAAHAFGATYRGRVLGSIGDLGTLSFHATKNIQCGEGGALLVNDPSLRERAEIIREKGTNRGRFFRGEVDKYTWVDVGSSYLPSEILAAFLTAQLDAFDEIRETDADLVGVRVGHPSVGARPTGANRSRVRPLPPPCPPVRTRLLPRRSATVVHRPHGRSGHQDRLPLRPAPLGACRPPMGG